MLKLMIPVHKLWDWGEWKWWCVG